MPSGPTPSRVVRLQRLRSQPSSAKDGTQVFTFGKYQHSGKSFEEVFEKDQAYVAWCCGRLAAGDCNSNQAAWMAYVDQKLDAAEKAQGIVYDDTAATPDQGWSMVSEPQGMQQTIQDVMSTVELLRQSLSELLERVTRLERAMAENSSQSRVQSSSQSHAQG